MLLGICGICLIGILSILLDNKKLNDRIDYTNEFINKYREFSNGLYQQNMNEELYQWLRLRSSKMQIMLGNFGIASMYKPPFSNIAYNDYQIVVNGLSEIRKEYVMVNSNLSYQNLNELIRIVDDCLVSFLGFLQDEHQDILTNLKNPIIWLREGIRSIVIFPVAFIYWSGLIKYNTYSRLSNNLVVRILTAIVALIGFISSIITISLGHEVLLQFLKIIKELL
jgi:hypothetical protein